MDSITKDSSLPGDLKKKKRPMFPEFCSPFPPCFHPSDFYFVILCIWDVFTEAKVMGQMFLLRDVSAEKLN